ncbi:MAG: hypothetical protein ACREOM_04345 [Candidatus Dormibacteraceae bacterium]
MDLLVIIRHHHGRFDGGGYPELRWPDPLDLGVALLGRLFASPAQPVLQILDHGGQEHEREDWAAHEVDHLPKFDM